YRGELHLTEDTGREGEAPCVGVGKAAGRGGLVLEGRHPVGDVAKLDRHERMAASTSSRLRSMRSGVRASRFSRSSGSVFDGRTFMCQSPASTESPSRWLTAPSLPKRCSNVFSFAGTSSTSVLISPVRK